MVLVALLFVPCMVMAITIALPMLMFVIAVVSMPILLCYQRCSIQMDYTTSTNATEADDSQNNSTVPISASIIQNDVDSSRSNSSAVTTTDVNLPSITVQKKKVTFQTNNDLLQPTGRVVLNEQQQKRPHRMLSTIPTAPMARSGPCLLYQSTRRYYYSDEREITSFLDMRYQNLSPQMYHPPNHPVCVG
jgi:hypothetical protein